MSKYLVQLSYTPESWAAQIKDPKNRVEVVKPVVDKLGCKIDAAYYSFGTEDLLLIMEIPDNQTAAALSFVFQSGGAVKSYKTTPLMSLEDGIAGLKQAGKAVGAYKPAK